VDSEKPEADEPSGSPSEASSARRRAERVTGGGDGDRKERSATPPGRAGEAGSSSDPGETADSSDDRGGDAATGPGAPPSGPSSSQGGAGPPRLTERQRIEAREKRRSERRGRRKGGRRSGSADRPESPSGNPLSRGVRATWLELKRTLGFAWGLILSGLEKLGPAFRYLGTALVALLAGAGRGLASIGRGLGAAMSAIGSLLLSIDRVITPRRALIAVAGGAVIALVASQFTDYRATEIGQTGYDPILEIATAPRTDVLTPADNHSILLLLVAAVALAAVAGAALTGKRVFGAVISLAGAITVAVSLLVDLPSGLDVGQAEVNYSEVAAVLLSGFWIQLGAGLVLAVGGLGLLMLSGRRQKRAAGDSDDPSRERSPRKERRARAADAGGLS